GKASLFPDVRPQVLADYGLSLTGVSGSQVRNLTDPQGSACRADCSSDVVKAHHP
ncbi:unnamed protein product, partial [Gulo gulo]